MNILLAERLSIAIWTAMLILLGLSACGWSSRTWLRERVMIVIAIMLMAGIVLIGWSGVHYQDQKTRKMQAQQAYQITRNAEINLGIIVHSLAVEQSKQKEHQNEHH